MKLKVIAILLVSLCLASCSGKPAALPSKNQSSDQAQAYYAVFQDLYAFDPGLNDGITYLALDLSNVKLADTSVFVVMIQGFCNDNGYTLLLDTMAGLEAKGYITESSPTQTIFNQGLLITFSDTQLDAGTLVTRVEKWKYTLGSDSADYTVKKSGGAWMIMEPVQYMAS